MFTDLKKIYKTTLLPNAKAGQPLYNCRTCNCVCTMIAYNSTLSFQSAGRFMCRTFLLNLKVQTYNKCYFAYFFLIICISNMMRNLQEAFNVHSNTYIYISHTYHDQYQNLYFFFYIYTWINKVTAFTPFSSRCEHFSMG